MPKFCHELDDFPELCRVISGERNILPQLVEKDYWIMHCLYGLEKLGFEFEMKGGTSLSKGWGLLERFSEDIDLRVNPPSTLPIGKNHRKSRHIEQRKAFFDELTERIKIDGIIEVKRELTFDDDQMRNAGIHLKYLSHFSNIDGVKSGVLLEIGFDQTTPNESKIISSWAYDKANLLKVEIIDNRTKSVKCYLPEYTFVEKLQAISTKFRQEQDSGDLKENQLRHYYDINCLLKTKRVQNFIGTPEYFKHKAKRFRSADEKDLQKNEAFIFSEQSVLERYEAGLKKIESLFYGEKPTMVDIIENIKPWLSKL